MTSAMSFRKRKKKKEQSTREIMLEEEKGNLDSRLSHFPNFLHREAELFSTKSER